MLYSAFGFNCQCERCEIGDIDRGRQVQDSGSDGKNLSQLLSSSSVMSSRPSSSIPSTSTSNDYMGDLANYLKDIVDRMSSKAARGGSEVNSNFSADDDILIDDEFCSLLHQSEMALRRGNCAADAVYIIHESGMLVLKSALGRRKSFLLQSKVETAVKPEINRDSTTKKKIAAGKMSIAEVDATAVRAVAVISQCWSLIGCEVK